MASKPEPGKPADVKTITTTSSSQPQMQNGYLDPLTAIPDAYRPRWKIIWEKFRNRNQPGMDQLSTMEGIRLTERNLQEFFNPEHDPNAEFEIEEVSREHDGRKRKMRVNDWIQGLP